MGDQTHNKQVRFSKELDEKLIKAVERYNQSGLPETTQSGIIKAGTKKLVEEILAGEIARLKIK